VNAKALFSKHKMATIALSYFVVSLVLLSVLMDSRWAWTEYVSPLLYPLISVNLWHEQGVPQAEIIVRQAVFNTLGVFLNIGVFLLVLSVAATGAWITEILKAGVEGTRVESWRVSFKKFWQSFRSTDFAVKIFSFWQATSKRPSFKNRLIVNIGNIKKPLSRNVAIYIFASMPGSLLPLLSATTVIVAVAELKHLRWREWTPWLIAGGINRAILDALIGQWLYAQLSLLWQILQQLIHKLVMLMEIILF